MTSRRLVTISEESWFAVGVALGKAVAEKSCFAYRFDKVIHEDDLDIMKLWRSDLAPAAKLAMQKQTPLAYDLCLGFDTIFSTKGDGFSVWELLTLYEVDMFLHEYHYKCRFCEKRVMQGPRFVCVSCHPEDISDDSDASTIKKRITPTKRKKKCVVENTSVCQSCQPLHANCVECACLLLPTNVLHETQGLGIANKAGCTGFARGDLCGQTLEMSTDTYNYGRFDTVYNLTNTLANQSVLVYDVGCILSPFGLNSSNLALCVFNLYNSDYALPPYKVPRVPMAAIQWEILLGSKSVNSALKFLQSIPKPFTSASFLITTFQNSHVVEISANKHWTTKNECIVRANNCLNESTLIPNESLPPNISSRTRELNLRESISTWTTTTNLLEVAKESLSTAIIQTDYCLGTIIMQSQILQMQVRFRVGTRISSTLKNGGKWEVYHIT